MPSPRSVVNKWKSHVSKKSKLRQNVGRILTQVAGGSTILPTKTRASLKILNKTSKAYVGNVHPNISVVRERAARAMARIRNIKNKMNRGESLTRNEITFLYDRDPSRLRSSAFYKNLYNQGMLRRSYGAAATINPGYQSHGMRNIQKLPGGMYLVTPTVKTVQNVSKSLIRSGLRKWKRTALYNNKKK